MASNPHSQSNKAVKAELQVEAYRLKLIGTPYRDIGIALGISHTYAHKLVMDEIASKVDIPREAVRQMMIDEIDRMIVGLEEILAATHYVVNHGKVIHDDDGNALIDHELKLKTYDRLVRLLERRAKLLGVDMPVESIQTTRVESPIDTSVMALVKAMDERADTERANLGNQG